MAEVCGKKCCQLPLGCQPLLILLLIFSCKRHSKIIDFEALPPIDLHTMKAM